MSACARSRRGFTLVELLVVIAIIGVLVALLLPAVQAAREAARRSQCSNHLKQLSLGVHNFHDVFKRMPPAGANDEASDFGKAPAGGRWGASWLVHILPFIEQKPMHDLFKFNGAGGGGAGWGGNPGDAYDNLIVQRNSLVGIFMCPSSPLEDWCTSPNHGITKTMAPSYVAISGGDSNLIPTATYNETRINTPASSAGCCSGGRHSASGAIIAAGKFGMESLQDGTSNVFMISEQANHIFTQSNQRQDWRSQSLHGWIIGWRANCTPPACGNNNDQRTFNFTTVRYPINHFSIPSHGLPDAPGNCSTHGVCDNASTNRPLNSAHPNGVMVALADGSVRFVSQSIPLDVLGRAVHRDDKLTLVLPN